MKVQRRKLGYDFLCSNYSKINIFFIQVVFVEYVSNICTSPVIIELELYLAVSGG